MEITIKGIGFKEMLSMVYSFFYSRLLHKMPNLVMRHSVCSNEIEP
ncbi:MAG TPA: hypothetical protein PK253_01770 [Spirochaetota bacterium]|nr:hypothetical protein [Spirochaetota bacterium]